MKKNCFLVIAALSVLFASCDSQNDPFENLTFPDTEVPAAGGENAPAGDSADSVAEEGICYYVAQDGNKKSFKTLQGAVNALLEADAVESYTIYVEGNVKGSTKISVESELNLSIVGSAESEAVLDGDGKGSVISASGSGLNLTLKNLTITGGNAVKGGGGGIYLDEASNVTLLNCIIGNKDALAVPTDESDCKARGGNFASGGGGGIYVSSKEVLCTLMIRDCIIAGNYTNGSGGGICTGGENKNKIIQIENSAINYNFANQSGGGMNICVNSGTDNEYTAAYAKATKIISNQAGNNGGGIAIPSGKSFSLIDCTEFFDNKAGISNNKTDKYGNGIYSTGTLKFFGSITIDSGNDIYLNKCKIVLGTGFQAAHDKIATITLPSTNYATDTTVLSEGKKGLLAENYMKFNLTQTISNGIWNIDKDGKLVPAGS